MAVYLFTYHAYRSWGPGRVQGYVRRGEGVLEQDRAMAQRYDRAARQPPIRFTTEMQPVIVKTVRSVCAEKGWRLHYVCVDLSHVHILVSWDGFKQWKNVSDTLKRWIGKELSKAFDRSGPWLSRGQSRKRVKDRVHYDHLLCTYLPKHDGLHWRE